VTRIRTAIESGDAETAARAAHTFKGVAGNIGATQMFERAAMVEGMLKQGKPMAWQMHWMKWSRN